MNRLKYNTSPKILKEKYNGCPPTQSCISGSGPQPYCFWDDNAGCVCYAQLSISGPQGSRQCNPNNPDGCSGGQDAGCCMWQDQNSCENCSIQPNSSNYDPNGWGCNPDQDLH